MLCNSVITITFGECAENHKGMQMLGSVGEIGDGFDLSDLTVAQDKLRSIGIFSQIIHLHENQPLEEKAYVLVIRQGLSYFGLESQSQLFNEMSTLDFDKKAYMYGRVVNKRARWNLCFSDVAQEPNYEEKRGRVISWSSVPILNQIKEGLVNLLGEKGDGLKAESNFYYDKTKCFIGAHGDSERRRVIAVRLGSDMPLYFHWYKDSRPVGNKITIPLYGGDIYIMSEKAVGTDWKKRSI